MITKPTINVDIRSTESQCGKTTIARLLVEALVESGWDTEHIQLDSADKDLTVDTFECLDDCLDEIQNKGTSIVITDLNLPIRATSNHTPSQIYEYSKHQRHGVATEWESCTYEEYLGWLHTPVQGEWTYRVRTRVQRICTASTMVSEPDIRKLLSLIETIGNYAEGLEVDTVYGNNDAGLKRALRAVGHQARLISQQLK